MRAEMSGTEAKGVDFSLLTAQDTKRRGPSQLNERFVEWIMVNRGAKRRDARAKAYRLGKVQRECGMTITTAEEASRAAAFVLSSDYEKATKRHKLYAIEDWMRFQGIEVHFKKPRASGRCPTYLRQEQLSALIRAVHDYREYALMALFIFTGARLSEVANLNVGNIKFATHEVEVRNTKSGRDRTLPLHPSTEAILREYLYRRGLGELTDDDPLFVSRRGERLSTRRMQDIVRVVAKRAGLKGVHAHVLRHSFATAWVENGGDVFHLSTLLGHSDVATTLRYWHWNQGVARTVYQRSAPRL